MDLIRDRTKRGCVAYDTASFLVALQDGLEPTTP